MAIPQQRIGTVAIEKGTRAGPAALHGALVTAWLVNRESREIGHAFQDGEARNNAGMDSRDLD
jgi:hypothetical protein